VKPASTIELVQLLLELQRRRATGVLTVAAEGVETRLYFSQGRAVFADGGALGETLGRMLVANGAISAEQYAHGIEVMTERIAANSTVRMGEVLVQLGYVAVNDVQQALIQQVRMRIARLLQFEQVTWLYEQDEQKVATMPAYPMRIEPQVLQGIRLFFDRDRMSMYLAGYFAGFAVLRAPAELIVRCFALSDSRARLLDSFDGSRTLHEWLDLQQSEDAWWLVTAMVIAGVLMVAEAPQSTRSLTQAASENPSLAPPGNTGSFEVALVRHGAALQAPRVPEASQFDSPSDPLAQARLQRLEAEKLMQAGCELLDVCDWEGAAGQFHAACQAMPDALEYQLYRAWARSRSEGPMVAASAAELEEFAMTTAKQDSQHGFPPYVLGHVALFRDDKETALRYFKIAQHRDPRNKDAAQQAAKLSRRR
jgi:Domain of unknown function (DUF4388)